MERPDFVQWGKITPAGQDVIDYMERHIKAAVELYEAKGDVDHLNGMTGTLKHYYTNVYTTHLISPHDWLKDHDYGANAMWSNLQYERKLEEDAKVTADQAAKTSDLAARLEKLESQLTEALDALKAKDQQIAALKEDDTSDDSDDDEEAEEKEPAKKPRRKSKKTQDEEAEDGPAEPAAEEAAETEETEA